MEVWVKWSVVSVHLEIVLVSVQDRCMICTKRTIGSEILLHAPDVTPRDMGLVECHSSPFRDVVSVATRYVHGLRQTYHRLKNHFGHT